MSLCIECAVHHHQFQEIPLASVSARSSASGAKQREALIDGKKHRLNHVRPLHVPCDDCRRVSGALFVAPEELA